MDLTPSPKLLQMLGEIEFDEWQCIAELIDNSFDSFLEIKRSGAPWPGGFRVSISLPSPQDSQKDAFLSIRDTGPGMTRDQLEMAVKAGFSSNDRFTKLGLFGMGFNVSTARLGGFTRVTTTQADDLFWNGVEIDFDSIDDSFSAPEIRIEKEYLPEHGTTIEIGKLKSERLAFLSRHESNLRLRLGKVYSYLLSEYDFILEINGVQVQPVRHCVWDKDRSVELRLKTGSMQVPAVIDVDFPLTPVDTCQSCGDSQLTGKFEACSNCGSTKLSYRERRIWGWLGVQRFLSPTDYGIDFLRNGRKILIGDRKLFEWRDPNDPNAPVIIEYPTELAHQGGRIVGEIHLDHIPVTYSKDAFEYSDKSWRTMVDMVRGEGPIRPRRASQLNYPDNSTPLGLLARAYAEAKPGIKYLMPGDGSQAIHAMTRDWGKKFAEGHEEYLSDEKWWEAAKNHDRIANGEVKTQIPEFTTLEELEGQNEIFGEFPPLQPKDEPGFGGSQSSQSLESNESRITRLSLCPVLTTLSTDVTVPSLSQTISLTVYGVNESGNLTDTSGNPTAVWLVPGKGVQYKAFLDLDNQLICKYGFAPFQVLSFEVARHLSLKADRADHSPSSFAAEIIQSNFSDQILSSKQAKNEAVELVRIIRSLLANANSDQPQKILNYLSAADQQYMQDEMMLSAGKLIPLSEPEALDFVPFIALLRIIEKEPGIFFDRRVFDVDYEGLATESAKFITRLKFAGLLGDLVISAASDNPLTEPQMVRTMESAKLLKQVLVNS